MPKSIPVFLVDDEPLIHLALEPALIEAGFEVSCALDGAGALLLLRDADGAFRALVTDINLGSGLNGWDLARLARQMVSDIPVVYASGGSEGAYEAEGVLGGVLISNPYDAGQIVQAVNDLIRPPVLS